LDQHFQTLVQYRGTIQYILFTIARRKTATKEELQDAIEITKTAQSHSIIIGSK
jgi:hypothetical protein